MHPRALQRPQRRPRTTTSAPNTTTTTICFRQLRFATIGPEWTTRQPSTSSTLSTTRRWRLRPRQSSTTEVGRLLGLGTWASTGRMAVDTGCTRVGWDRTETIIVSDYAFAFLGDAGQASPSIHAIARHEAGAWPATASNLPRCSTSLCISVHLCTFQSIRVAQWHYSNILNLRPHSPRANPAPLFYHHTDPLR